MFLHQPADQTHREHHDDAIDRIGHGIGTDYAEQENDGKQDIARHPQQLLAAFDRSPAHRQHQDVGENEDDEYRVDELRVLQEHGGAGVHALHVEYADHDRRDGIAGYSKHQCWNPGAAERRIIGRRGVDDAFDMAGAEFFGLFREPLRYRERNPCRNVGAGAGQCADQHANRRPTEKVEPIAFEHAEYAGENIADLLGDYGALLIHADHAAQEFREREHADHRGDETDALEQFDAAEGEARITCSGINADAVDGEAEQQRGDALERRVGGHEDRAGQAEQRQPEIFEGGEIDGDFGERRRAQDQDRDADKAAHHRKHEVDAEVEVQLPLFRHRIAFVGVGRGRRGAGNSQERRWDIAGEYRHRRGGNDCTERRHGIHEERHRHQQCRCHGRRQPRHCTDEHAEGGGCGDHPEHVGIEHQAAGGEKGIHIGLKGSSSSSRAAAGLAGGWRRTNR